MARFHAVCSLFSLPENKKAPLSLRANVVCFSLALWLSRALLMKERNSLKQQQPAAQLDQLRLNLSRRLNGNRRFDSAQPAPSAANITNKQTLNLRLHHSSAASEPAWPIRSRVHLSDARAAALSLSLSSGIPKRFVRFRGGSLERSEKLLSIDLARSTRAHRKHRSRPTTTAPQTLSLASVR